MMLDSVGRRSRFKRTRTGKRLTLGDRDIEILRWLYRYRYLRQTHLLKLLRPKSEKRFVERLGDLFHETGLIDRPEANATLFDAHCMSMLYEISDAGIAYLTVQDALPERAVTFSRRRSRGHRPQLLHQLMIIETLTDIELACLYAPNERFVPIDEILARAPATTRDAPNPLSIAVTLRPNSAHPIIRSPLEAHVIPDALYGIEYEMDGQKLYRFWALECERTSPASRSTTVKSSTALKRAAYHAMIATKAFQGHWGIPNLELNVR